ncbi:GNAT family N-acetyltransferase [Listeria ivanovii]|uniref:GNAT family N-acetyltransferase n=1 Tax=Listeria ivanovii TaxID=1638 RepID=UPI000512898A|nr:GNAT family N-acetyltransferase [Listeria ivanovii]AIS63349.1 GNAT family acetyltransferase [Listeria ivanovii subsp. londoniensis]MBC2255851.1 GNAT family N-acetyltransferase [Listeria ivanovii]MBK1966419.1 GNAT family N-acetyltransferase [Listeria ivanovii subsp. londoniensis]MBK1983628.1 GNAT family N-acetyltransferase [Listeria ivanovii subsp. londoniensis]MBK1995156.1 GNAT family N-acetyltransferase [Listeria ivanovii subsp. londoniensis]
MHWTIWDKSKPSPLELLLEADPSETQITQYLDKSTVFELKDDEKTMGVVCLLPINNHQIEIMNIAVLESIRNNGLGKKLLEKAFDFANSYHFTELIVKTGNSSINQLAFYQKNGFRIQKIVPNYFSEQYPNQAIIENGIPCLDQIILLKEIKS